MKRDSMESWAEGLKEDVEVPAVVTERIEDALKQIENGEVAREGAARASSARRGRVSRFKHPRLAVAAAAVAAVVVVGAAFGAGTLAGGHMGSSVSAQVAESYDTAAAVDDSAYGSDDMEDGAVAENADASAAVPLTASKAASADVARADLGSEASSAEPAAASSDKIVYTAYVSVETAEYAQAKDKLHEQVRAFGAIVEYENEQLPGTQRTSEDPVYIDDYETYGSDYSYGRVSAARLELRVKVPAGKYEKFVAALSDVGVVVSKSATADNISKTYAETEAEIEALKTEQKRLTELLGKASDVEDMIAIEERLSDIRSELAAQKNYKEELDTDLAYSTVTVTLADVSRVPQAAAQETLAERIAYAASQGWELFTGALAALLVGIVTAWPLLIVLAIVAIVLVAVARSRRRKAAVGNDDPDSKE